MNDVESTINNLVRKRVLVTGGAGFLGSTCAIGCSPTATR